MLVVVVMTRMPRSTVEVGICNSKVEVDILEEVVVNCNSMVVVEILGSKVVVDIALVVVEIWGSKVGGEIA